jgi:hypothetical protein
MKLNEYSTQGWDFVKKATFVITPIWRVITKLSTGVPIGMDERQRKENHMGSIPEFTRIAGEFQGSA